MVLTDARPPSSVFPVSVSMHLVSACLQHPPATAAAAVAVAAAAVLLLLRKLTPRPSSGHT